jgi:hypothetical protein
VHGVSRICTLSGLGMHMSCTEGIQTQVAERQSSAVILDRNYLAWRVSRRSSGEVEHREIVEAAGLSDRRLKLGSNSCREFLRDICGINYWL